MKTLHHTQDGFIPMLLTVLFFVVLALAFAFIRVKHAQQ
jgi:hypothetical protein